MNIGQTEIIQILKNNSKWYTSAQLSEFLNQSVQSVHTSIKALRDNPRLQSKRVMDDKRNYITIYSWCELNKGFISALKKYNDMTINTNFSDWNRTDKLLLLNLAKLEERGEGIK